MRWKYLLYDLDGTLTDPMQGITRSVQYALHHCGIEVADLQTLCPFIGPPLADSFREFYHMTDAQAAEAIDRYHEYFVENGIFDNKLYPGIPELLAEAVEAGCINVMATSKPEPLAEQIARHFDFAQYFHLICGSMCDGRRPTKTDVIRHALSELGINAHEAVMIGDRRFDIEGAAAVGIASVAVSWGYASDGELEAAHPDFMVSEVESLRKLLL